MDRAPVPALTAVGASAALVLAGPFMGQLRGGLRALLSDAAYRMVLAAGIGVALVAVLAFAISRIRSSGMGRAEMGRGRRYAMLALALLAGAAYAVFTATGNAAVDLVERVHFLEYGLLAMLCYRVWRRRADLAAIVSPALAALLVAIADEWFQWFVPERVGEMRDVALNAVAIGCGLLFGVALAPPGRVAAAGLPATAPLAAAAVLAFGAFFAVVHVGHDVQFGASSFRSRFTAGELDRLAADRARRWSEGGAPVTLRRLSREDQYLAEGIWHVQHRNEAVAAGDLVAAWRENEILERFFTPVLDTASYAAPDGSRWSAAQRADVQASASADTRRYESRAAPFPIYAVNQLTVWGAAIALACTIWALGFLPRRPAAAAVQREVT